MPWGDVQFWVVTAIALGGVWVFGRAVVPKRAKRKKTRATLTVSAPKRR